MMYRISLVAILLLSNIATAQLKSKVHTIHGTEVYLLAEPVRPYEVVNTANNKIKWGSFFTMGLINQSVSKKVTSYIKALNEEFLKEGIKFDAVLYDSGKNIIAIKFTDEPTAETKGIAIVHKLDGIPFYVMSEPLKKYNYVSKIGKGIKWKSLVTAGLWNNSIEQDLLKFARKVDGKFKRKKISAVIYSNGKKAITVKF